MQSEVPVSNRPPASTTRKALVYLEKKTLTKSI